MTMLLYLLCLIEKIPASFWGVVIGSFFTIIGITLTNRASDKRLRAQFEHEQNQKTKDREMALRKEVYLAAAEAISAGTNAIARFANLDLPNDQITAAYVEKAPAIAKVHVIAKIKTVRAITDLTSELGTIFLKLFARRFELIVEKNQIGIIDNQIVEFGKERDRNLEMMKQHNIEGIVDDRRWQVIQSNFDFEAKRINEALAHRSELWKSLYAKQLEFMRECVSYTMTLGKLMVPALLAAREDLELPLDEQSYRQIVEDAIAKQELAIDGFVQKFMSVIAQPVISSDAPHS